MLIANPTAGQGRVRWVAGFLQSALERQGAEVTLILTGGPRDAAEAAEFAVSSERFQRVVVAGGDGTVNQVVRPLLGTRMPLAVLPLGTANSLAWELRLPFDIMRAARVAITGPVVDADVGKVGELYFLLEVSAGFDAAVVCSTRRPLKRWLGPGAYVINGLSLLRTHAPFTVRFTCDGQLFETRANVVIGANTATYVYGLRLARNASLHDGLIDLCVLESGRHAFGWQVAAALINRLGPRVGARVWQGRKFVIESDPPAFVQVDGEPAGTTPIEIECVPAALRLVTPERYLRRLRSTVASSPAGIETSQPTPG